MIKCGLDLGSHYLNQNSRRYMVLALSFEIQKNLWNDIVSSGSHVSLMIDESIDSSNQSKLLLLLRYCNGMKISQKYFALGSLSNQTALTIFSKIWELMTSEEYIMNRLILIMGDNEKNIQGEFSGVISRFKEQFLI